jgi:hypothetical protein
MELEEIEAAEEIDAGPFPRRHPAPDQPAASRVRVGEAQR